MKYCIGYVNMTLTLISPNLFTDKTILVNLTTSKILLYLSVGPSKCPELLHGHQPVLNQAVQSMNIVTIKSGQRNILNKKEEDTIISLKGSVRGMQNRVRAGIATFEQDQSRKVMEEIKLCFFQSLSIMQNYLFFEPGECSVYLTSLGIVRSTQERCNMVRKILRNMCVR